ncbi:MAG: 6-phosphogluconolactonase [Prevotellaceae bacterium]|jgi:6-phosphogluconolactonase|nr:6-phosphogluconolactonase [Prevotellaceae bacterium]
MTTYQFPTAVETARALLEQLIRTIEAEPQRIFHIAFSGGNTPSLMFDLWAEEFSAFTPWKRMRFYWVDERCVPWEDSDSNFGNMRRLMLSKVPLSTTYIHPINGAAPPAGEAARYSKLVTAQLPKYKGRPTFDLVLLGAGDDGHTSSIFPGQEELLSTSEPYVVSVNPYNHQTRIALTGPLILAAERVIFLITGRAKANVVDNMLHSGDISPAAYVAHHARQVELFLGDVLPLHR